MSASTCTCVSTNQGMPVLPTRFPVARIRLSACLIRSSNSSNRFCVSGSMTFSSYRCLLNLLIQRDGLPNHLLRGAGSIRRSLHFVSAERILLGDGHVISAHPTRVSAEQRYLKRRCLLDCSANLGKRFARHRHDRHLSDSHNL